MQRAGGKIIVLLVAATLILSLPPALAGNGNGGSDPTTETVKSNQGKGAGSDKVKVTGKGKGGTTTTTTTTTPPDTTTTTTTTTAPPDTTTTTTTIPPNTTTTTTIPPTTTTTTTTLPPTTTTTTTTLPPTTTTTTVPPTTTTTTTVPPNEPVEWVSPEGVTIVIDSAGGWTVDAVYGMLLENALDLDLVGPTLTIKVQDNDLSSTTAGVAGGPGGYYDFSATMHLKGVESSFADKPDAILAHEYGHAWSLYHLYLTQQGDWSVWLEFRGLAGDPQLDTTYPWSKTEMIAEDYRLLFSSPTAIAQWPGQMNADISDARDVPDLAGFLENVWGG